MNNILKTTTAILAFAALSGTASATSLVFNYSGVVESTNDGNIPLQPVANVGPLEVGDAFSGTFVLDTTVLGSGSLGTTESYADAVTGFSLTIDGLTFSSADASNTFSVRDNDMSGSSAPLRDSVLLSAFNPTGPMVAGLTPSVIQFSIGGTDTSVLSSLAIPSVAEFEALFAADTIAGNLNFLSFDDGTDVRLAINEFSVAPALAPVPLPAAAPMLLAGIGGMIALRRRRKS